ncbi:ANK1 [Branchiostoma lanceolatum]|uniref:ANK1 protein n=1 Tax=Branchiostoma lanceolatum TaxID=7740 RepID=A0A8K0A4H0_BRALA|nr:ANK1 [Branchiostoma lanceolatum]
MSKNVTIDCPGPEKPLDVCAGLKNAIDKADIDCLKNLTTFNRSSVNTEFDHEHGQECMKTSALMYACYRYTHFPPQRNQLKEVFDYLIAAGADVKITTSSSWLGFEDIPRTTPLIAAVVKKDWELVGVLLSCGADPNGRDDNQRTPLEMALCYKKDKKNLVTDNRNTDEEDIRVANLLVNKDADTNIQKDGKPLLEHALGSKNVYACQMLAKAGADLSYTTADGFTPLHSASVWGNFAVVKAFVDAGADITAKTAGLKQTPLEVYQININATKSPPSADPELVKVLTIQTNPRKRTRSQQDLGSEDSARPTSVSQDSRAAPHPHLAELQQVASPLLGMNFTPFSDPEEEDARIDRNRGLLTEDRFHGNTSCLYRLDSESFSLIHERKRSVCKVEWPYGSGTGVLLGKRTILTTHHIFNEMTKAIKRCKDPNRYRVSFESVGNEPITCNIAPKQPLSTDSSLDYAILNLELETGHQSEADPSILPLGACISDSIEKNDMIVVVGHTDRDKKKHIDFSILSGLSERYGIHVLFPPGLPIFPRDDTCKGFVFEGSSGSAGFDRNGNLVLMYTRGFSPIENEACLIEQGVRLSSIREHAHRHLTGPVFQELFPMPEEGFSFQ